VSAVSSASIHSQTPAGILCATSPAPRELSIGIVIPVLNEAAILPQALERLAHVAADCQIVVADGGSSDGSAAIARRRFPTLELGRPGRGTQMNAGAAALDADVLVFLHADSALPADFAACIRGALRSPRVAGGCFRLRFDVNRPWLRFYAWCTRFSHRFFHFGDQAFFVRRRVFEEMGGYREWVFMEDVEFLKRLRRRAGFTVLDAEVTTSARRFVSQGAVRQQLRNIVIVTLFELGVPAARLAALYPHVR